MRIRYLYFIKKKEYKFLFLKYFPLDQEDRKSSVYEISRYEYSPDRAKRDTTNETMVKLSYFNMRNTNQRYHSSLF